MRKYAVPTFLYPRPPSTKGRQPNFDSCVTVVALPWTAALVRPGRYNDRSSQISIPACPARPGQPGSVGQRSVWMECIHEALLMPAWVGLPCLVVVVFLVAQPCCRQHQNTTKDVEYIHTSSIPAVPTKSQPSQPLVVLLLLLLVLLRYYNPAPSSTSSGHAQTRRCPPSPTTPPHHGTTPGGTAGLVRAVLFGASCLDGSISA
jgi:hypothetical protein